ncbi:head-tail connector protein [Xanthomonas axonopodis]
MLTTIDDAIDYVRADAEDNSVAVLLAAAEAACFAVLNRNVYAGVVPNDDATGIAFTADIRGAVLITFGALYVHRDGSVGSDIPAAALALLRAHRWIPQP